MIVNFRARKNNQGVHKLIRISMLKKKKKTKLLTPCIDRSLTTFPRILRVAYQLSLFHQPQNYFSYNIIKLSMVTMMM